MVRVVDCEPPHDVTEPETGRRAGHDDVGNAQVDSEVPSHRGSRHGRAAASVSSSTGGEAEPRRRFDLGQPDMDGRSADTSNPPRPDVPKRAQSGHHPSFLGEVQLNTDPGVNGQWDLPVGGH